MFNEISILQNEMNKISRKYKNYNHKKKKIEVKMKVLSQD